MCTGKWWHMRMFKRSRISQTDCDLPSEAANLFLTHFYLKLRAKRRKDMPRGANSNSTSVVQNTIKCPMEVLTMGNRPEWVFGRREIVHVKP